MSRPLALQVLWIISFILSLTVPGLKAYHRLHGDYYEKPISRLSARKYYNGEEQHEKIKPNRHQVPNELNIANKVEDLSCPKGIDGLFAHPFDQTRFFNCHQGRFSVHSCLPNQVFSLSKGYCLSKKQLNIRDYVAHKVLGIGWEYSMMPTICPPGTHGLHFYPFDGSKYLICGAGGKMSVLSCEANMAFSFRHHGCRELQYLALNDHVKLLSPDLKPKTCPPHYEGYFVHPFDATMFIYCHNEQASIHTCELGTTFCVSQQRCLANDQLPSDDSTLRKTKSSHYKNRKTKWERRHKGHKVPLKYPSLTNYLNPQNSIERTPIISHPEERNVQVTKHLYVDSININFQSQPKSEGEPKSHVTTELPPKSTPQKPEENLFKTAVKNLLRTVFNYHSKMLNKMMTKDSKDSKSDESSVEFDIDEEGSGNHSVNDNDNTETDDDENEEGSGSSSDVENSSNEHRHNSDFYFTSWN